MSKHIPAGIQATVDAIMARNRARFAGFTMRLGAIETLEARVAELDTQIDALIGAPMPEEREAAAAANAEIEARTAERGQVEERLRVAREQEVRRQAEADARGQVGADGRAPVVVLSEPRAYEDTRHSYFLDLVRSEMNRGDGDGGVASARERLQRHAQELAVDLPAREARRDEYSERQADGLIGRRDRVSTRARENMFEKRVNPNRTDGQGGFFVPPLWLVDEYIDLPRFGRTTANLCRTMGLPSGTDSINLPKVATGTATGVQTADAGGVTSTDLTDTSVSAPVRTIAGQQDIALQLLDQSPISFDEVVFADLIADYNAQLDTQVINGSGSSGQLKGILQVSGINAVTYTDGTPTLPELWVPLLQSASQVAKGRKVAPATGVVMTPSMWYWALSQLDTTNRPLIVPNTQAFNSMGDAGLLESDGPAGMFTYGLPSFLDGNIPSNLGGGTNETRVITARWQDLFLWEGSMRTRVLQEVLSGTLQVRLQVYNYAAFMGDRRPTSISVISGTGVIPAAGF
jgi:HK97 family phage major capsid protein